MYIYMYIFEPICIFVESMNTFTGVVEHHACAGVYVRQMLWRSAYTFASRSLQDVHMRYVYTCVYAYVYVYICGYACIYIYMYVCIYIYMHIYMDVYMCVCVCIFVYMYICMYMYVYIYIYMSLYRIYVQFVSFSIAEWGWGGSTILWERLLLGVGGIFDRRKDRGVVCVFSIFNAGGSVCGCECVYTYTHTHTVQMGYLDASPRVGMRHLEGPKNPDGLNLGTYIFVYVYKVHMCIYMLRRWWDLGLTTVLFNMSFILRKVEEVTTIIKPQSLTSVRTKDGPWEIQTKPLHYFFLSNNKSNLHFTMYTYINIHVYVCVYMCIYVYNEIFTHVCIHIHHINIGMWQSLYESDHSYTNIEKLYISADYALHVCVSFVYCINFVYRASCSSPKIPNCNSYKNHCSAEFGNFSGCQACL